MTPERQAEAERVELVYYWALNRLGNALALDAIEAWNRTVPELGTAASTAAEFNRIMLRLLSAFRREAHELAISYYRLTRALRTGTTVAYAGETDGQTTSLEQLRQDFELVLDDIAEQTSGDPVFDTGDPEIRFDQEFPGYDPSQEDDLVTIEDIGDIDQLIEDANQEAASQAEDRLLKLGVQNLEKKLEQVENRKRADDKTKNKLRTKARADAGNRSAAAAMQIMLNAARGLTYDLTLTDQRIIGWARYSSTGSPCAFCAMLLSREVLYKSRSSALVAKNDDGNRVGDPLRDDVNKYHDNCRCVAIPIFDLKQFDESLLFQKNHFYADLWDDNIADRYSGDDALREWRKLLREREKEKAKATPEAA